jgi:hypothetical protein
MISSLMQSENTPHQDLYSGLIRLHILHHACEGEIFGLEMRQRKSIMLHLRYQNQSQNVFHTH